MLATRPASSEGASSAQAEELSDAAPQEEKRIPGVKQDALKDERRPLLDLEDVLHLETELAAFFDAPPPPPLNIDFDIEDVQGIEDLQGFQDLQDIQCEETTATVSDWTPAAEPRYLDTHYVAPHAPSLPTAVRGGEQQQQQQATRVSDYSSLYSPPTNLAVSSRQTLYPALVPTAPSADVARTHSQGEQAAGAWAQTATGQAVESGAATRGASGATATAEIDPAVVSGITEQGGSQAAAEARERGGASAGAAAAAVAAKAGEAPVLVVEELLSENERLRLIIQDMSEELDRVTFQLTGGHEGVAREESAHANEAARTQARARAPEPRTRTEAEVASASATSLLNRYPGAQAEAMRRRREAGGQQSEQQQQQQEQEQGTNQEQVLRRGIFVHFKCDNCPQWLKVPGHAQLVYCPTCSHTSQMTSGSTIHFPRNNQIPQAAGSASAAASSATAPDTGEGVGWLGYIKSVLAS